jgi:hypothetical protein
MKIDRRALLIEIKGHHMGITGNKEAHEEAKTAPEDK